jgi:hypothetical protein
MCACPYPIRAHAAGLLDCCNNPGPATPTTTAQGQPPLPPFPLPPPHEPNVPSPIYLYSTPPALFSPPDIGSCPVSQVPSRLLLECWVNSHRRQYIQGDGRPRARENALRLLSGHQRAGDKRWRGDSAPFTPSTAPPCPALPWPFSRSCFCFSPTHIPHDHYRLEYSTSQPPPITASFFSAQGTDPS